MAEKTSQGLNLYNYMTDKNRDIYDGTFGKTDGTNPSSMEVINNFMENKLTLNGEKSKQNFNFIENKVVQDGLVYSEFNKSYKENTFTEIKDTAKVVNGSYTIFFKSDFVKKPDGTNSILFGSTHTEGIYSNYSNTLNSNVYHQGKLNNNVFKPLSNVLFVKDSEYLKIYVDNELVKTYVVDNSIIETKNIFINRGADVYNFAIQELKHFVLYNRALTPQEIQHNFSVLNNSPSINQLQVTNSPNQTSILSLGTDGNHVEMSSGRTLEEEYMGVLECMSQEYTSTGGAITVNDALKARLIGAEITGQTVKNYLSKSLIMSIPNATIVNAYGRECFKLSSPNKAVSTGGFNVGQYTISLSATNFETFTSGSQRLIVIAYYTDGTTSSYANALPFDNVPGTFIDITFTTQAGKTVDRVVFTYGNAGNILIDINKCSCVEGLTKQYIPFGLSSTVATISNNGIKYPFYQQYVEGETVVQKRAKGSSNEWVTIPQDETRDTVANEYRLYSANGLGSVPSVEDTVDLASGIKTDNTKEIVLNGSETWGVRSTINQNDTISFECNGYISSVTGGSSIAICDKLNHKDVYSNLTNDEGFNVHLGYLRICVFKSKLSTQDVNGFKAWLQSNPITVRYQLATPTTAQLTPSQLQAYAPYKKQILLGKVDTVADKLTLNSDGSVLCNVNNLKVTYSGKVDENWIAATHGETVCKFNIILPTQSKYTSNSMISNQFNQISSVVSNDIEAIATNGSQVYIGISKTKLQTQDVVGLKQYLQSNPLEIVYQLATPTTTTIPKEVNSPVLTNQSNVLQAGEAVLPSSFSVKIPTTSQIKKQYAQTLLNNYTGTASANLLKDGRVQLDMTVTIPSTFNQTVFSLPPELRPKVARKVMGFNGNNPVTLLVGTDGTVKIPTAITGTVELCDEYDL